MDWSHKLRIEWKVVSQLASAVGIALEPYEARTLQDLDQASAAIVRSVAQMLFVLNDPFIFTHRKSIIEAAAKSRLPAIYGFREFVDDGGLISYGPNISDGYRRAAEYVDKVLQGAKPADLPVQAPTKYELVINLKTAKALGLEVRHATRSRRRGDRMGGASSSRCSAVRPSGVAARGTRAAAERCRWSAFLNAASPDRVRTQRR